MYKNAGKSIKNIVRGVVGILLALFILLGIILACNDAVILGLIVAGVGCFFAWLSGLILYAYGDMADNIRVIAEALTVSASSDDSSIGFFEFNTENRNLSKFQRNMVKEYRAQLENGVLTQEEYKNKVQSILTEN